MSAGTRPLRYPPVVRPEEVADAVEQVISERSGLVARLETQLDAVRRMRTRISEQLAPIVDDSFFDVMTAVAEVGALVSPALVAAVLLLGREYQRAYAWVWGLLAIGWQWWSTLDRRAYARPSATGLAAALTVVMGWRTVCALSRAMAVESAENRRPGTVNDSCGMCRRFPSRASGTSRS